jgi:predicted deacylase
MTAHDPRTIAGHVLEPGTRTEMELRPAKLPSGGWMSIPVVAVHGAAPGPTMWLSAAIHGDEICGVEIIRQILASITPKDFAGTLLAVPIVNVPGFATGDRYMPDRRDLNRSFPGSKRGSLASRFAHAFMTEIVQHCDVGIDLHTGSDHRRNVPQIRADLSDDPTAEPPVLPTVVLGPSSWARSPQSGLARLAVDLGDHVTERQPIGVVADAIGNSERTVRATRSGIVIGRNESPVVHRGDALVHIGAHPTTETGATP